MQVSSIKFEHRSENMKFSQWRRIYHPERNSALLRQWKEPDRTRSIDREMF